MRKHYGALPGAWDHFDLILGLGEDLLPVAANPRAKISPTSTLTTIGKVPSVYNREGFIVGLSKWTERVTTPDEIVYWSKNPELGICLQTRRVRALDVDIPDQDEAKEVAAVVREFFGDFPMRSRADSAKFLLLMECQGEIPKRSFVTRHGKIELLGTGQQCVVDSTHPDGARYEWVGGFPQSIPVISLNRLNMLWDKLAEHFAIEDTVTGSLSNRKERITNIISEDPVVQALSDSGLILSQTATGMLAIRCPFDDDHTPGSSLTSTVYFPPHTGGYEFGHFDCKHASCAHRDDTDFKEAIGLRVNDYFEVLPDGQSEALRVVPDENALRYPFKRASEFVQGAQPKWIVRNVLPMAELAMIYGESGSGKSFFALDMLCAICRGVAWQGNAVMQGSVAYIAAEGAGGVKSRIRAYADHNGLDVDDLSLYVLGDSPNFLERKDIGDVIAGLRGIPALRVVLVDTAACVVPGGDENSGKDMGRLVKHCKAIHQATGALVVLVHHSGKDSSKGARGWSGLRGALDAEICVTRDGRERVASITKQKDGTDEDMDFGFTLIPVSVGMDDEGVDVISCVLDYFDLPPKNERKIPVRGTEQTLIDWITDYEDERKEWPTTAEVLDSMPRAVVLIEKLKEKNQVTEQDGRIAVR